jgi:K+-sensing histidine kinase KdpD
MRPFFPLKWLIEQPVIRPGSWAAYLTAAIIVGVATALRMLLSPWLFGAEFVAFYLAVIATSLLCGAAAGLFAAVLSVVSVILFVIPTHTVSQADADGLVLAAVMGAAIIAVLRSALPISCLV